MKKTTRLRNRVWQGLLAFILAFAFSSMSFGQNTYTENFDTHGNWAGGSYTGYNAKTYVNDVDDPANDGFSTNAAVREASHTNSTGYAWRVDDLADAYFRYETEDIVNSFSVYMAIWDNSPKPKVTIRYSTDSGTSYTDIEFIDGDGFSGSKIYQKYSHTFSSAISPDAGQKIFIEFITTAGERMMYDDFEVSYGSGTPTPTITVSSALTGLDNDGSAPSASQSFTVEGANLTEDLIVTPPINFEISSDDITFVSNPTTITIPFATANAGVTTLHTRLKTGLAVATYTEDITCASTGADDQIISCEGTVAAPSLTLTAPNGGEIWEQGKTEAITWTSALVGNPTNVKIEIAEDGSTYDKLVVASTENDGTYEWSIPVDQAIAATYKVKVSDAADGTPVDESSDPFEIVAPPPAPELFISEVADPIASAGRFVEIYNYSELPIDLAANNVYLVKQVNGGTQYDMALTGIIAAGDAYVIAKGSDFLASYGFSADEDVTNTDGNGDDGYYLYYAGDETTGTLLDSYGVIGEDGSGKDWEYENSHAERNSYILLPNSTWTASEWTITGGDIADMNPGTHTAAVDNDAPVATFDPANTTSGVAIDVNPTITFDENVFKAADGSAFTTDEVVTGLLTFAETVTTTPVDFTATINGKVITIVPASDLNYELSYTLILAANSVEDASTNENIETTTTFETLVPTITATETLTGFTYVFGAGPSLSQAFVVSGSDLSSNIIVTLPASYEISENNTDWQSTAVTLPVVSGDVAETTLYARLKAGLSVATYNENIACSSTDATTKNVALEGTVNAAPAPEPTNHVSDFTATANSISEISLTWTDDAAGAQAAENFLVLASTSDSFSAPVDGTPQVNDVDLSDGSAVVNVAAGTQTLDFTGLSENTAYYFTIYPYTNTSTIIDFKTDGTVPTANTTTCTTPAAPNATAATGTDYQSFTANWDAVTGADSYKLDVYTEEGGSSPELVLNGDFESWTAGVPDGWTTIESGTTITEETTEIHGGSSSASFEVTTGDQGSTDFRQTVTVENGKTYDFSVWVKHTEGFMKARLFVSDYEGYSDNSNTTTWQEVTHTYTATSDGDIEVGLRFYDQTGVDLPEIVYVDDLSFKKQAESAVITYVKGYEDKTVAGTSDAVTGLTPSTAYKYVVRAHSDCGVGYTSVNSYVIEVATPIDPTAPTLSDVTLSGTSPYYAGNDVTVNWVSTNIDFVNIYAFIPEDGEWSLFAENLSDDGSELLTIPTDAIYGTTYKLMIADASDTTMNSESAAFEIRAVAATLADLRNNNSVGDVVKYTGNAIVSFTQTYRNQIFIQDANGGILIDDATPIITSTYVAGDQMTGLEGTISEYQGMLQIVPIADLVAATVHDQAITAPVVSISDLTTSFDMYEARMVTIEGVNFTDANGVVTFVADTEYELNTGTETFTFKTLLAEVNYLTATTIITEDKVDVEGLLITTADGNYITSVSIDNFVDNYGALASFGTLGGSTNVDPSGDLTLSFPEVVYKDALQTVFTVNEDVSAGFKFYGNSKVIPELAVDFTALINGQVITIEINSPLPSASYIVLELQPNFFFDAAGNATETQSVDFETGTSADITFNVDMSIEFYNNAWDSIATNLDVLIDGFAGEKMYDANKDLVYSVLVPNQLVGDVITYRFRKNGETDKETADRIYTIVAGANILDTVYYNDEVPAFEANIVAFTIANQVSSEIITAKDSVYVTMLFGTNLSSLTPTINVSPGATVTPNSGVAQDFTTDVKYTITSYDGTAKEWWVHVENLEFQSSAAEIETFSFAEETKAAIINTAAATVTSEVEWDADLATLVPTFTISAGAMVSPTTTGVAQDFTNAFVYTVTAEDGITEKEWTVNVTKQVVADVTFNVNMNKQINLGEFIAGTDALTITGTVSGTCTDADADGIYTFVAANQAVGSSIDYKFQINATAELIIRSHAVIAGTNEVTVWYNDVELATEALITSTVYTVNDVAATIVDIPFGTDLVTFKSNLTASAYATFELYEADGTTVATTVATGFKLAVTSEDLATTKIYTLAVDVQVVAVTSSVYTVDDVAETIVDIPFGTDLVTFESNLTASEAASFILYEADGATIATTVVTGFKLIVTSDDLSVSKTYVLTVDEEVVVNGGVFFSEYIEGSANNKALEIYNGTGAEVDLSSYVIRINGNGSAWSSLFEFPTGTMVADKDVYVLAHSASVPEILAVTDTVVVDPYGGGTSYVAVFNGDDVRGLFKVEGTDTILIDIIGANDLTQPSNGWDVAGVTTATKDHTLVRKTTILEGNAVWAASAGTDADNSEWVVYDKDDFSHLGNHNAASDEDAPIATFTPANGATNVITTSDVTITFDEMVYKAADGAEFTEGEDVSSMLEFYETATPANAVAFAATITGNVVTIVPSADLTYNLQYTVVLKATSVEDAFGNENVLTSSAFTTIDATTPYIVLTAPLGGETVYAGDESTITWTSANIENVKIEVYVPEISSWQDLVASTPAADGSEVVTVNAEASYSTAYKIRISDVTDAAVFDMSGEYEVIALATDIASLRTNSIGDKVKLTGNATVTFVQTLRNQKFIQDASAAVLIDDASGIITSTYVAGDQMPGIEGSISEYGNMMQFVPTVDPGEATASGLEVTPTVLTITEFTANFEAYEAQLITFEAVNFADATGTEVFAINTAYDLTDGTNVAGFYTNFSEVDYIGASIPTTTGKVTGIAVSRSTGTFITSRNASELEFAAVPTYTVTFTVTNEDAELVLGAVVAFNGTELTTDANGIAEFTEVNPVTDAPFTVTGASELYVVYNGTVSVTNADVNVPVTLISVGIEDNAGLISSMYPNPTNGIVNVVLNENVSNAMLTITSITGQVIETRKISEMEETIDLSNQEAGVYFIRIVSNNQSYLGKVILK
ncbi:MAG: lamin tail domain-containing protein [Salinivirgaceae bacterium]|nr:lamin tail domain-containing protein [Salinivirgaceae bacterium]